jgi:hypothetical protein
MYKGRMSAALALTVGLAVFAVGCTEQSTLTDPTDVELKNGPPDGGGGPPDGKGPGGGGHEPGASNNLSVPLINIGGSWTGVTCPLAAEILPSGDPATGYEIDPAAFYYVQGLNTWQAECVAAETASADAFWGDNLSGDAKLKVGMPIRVEIGLETPSAGMDGFTVVKLEPSMLDRESAYGTLATCDAELNCSATVKTFTTVRVFDSGATWSVMKDGGYVIEPEPIGSEINATGKAVYGYNLRVGEAGSYTITFSFPNVLLTSGSHGTEPVCAVDGTGAVVPPCDVSLDINVVTGGGGGGKPH